jgi:hypothetical protein
MPAWMRPSPLLVWNGKVRDHARGYRRARWDFEARSGFAVRPAGENSGFASALPGYSLPRLCVNLRGATGEAGLRGIEFGVEENTMRFPEAVRMPDDGGTPVWARANRSRGGAFNTIFGFLAFVLAGIGLLTLVMAIMNDMSFAKGGAKVDHWIAPVVGKIHHSDATAGQPSAALAPASAPASSAPSAPASSAGAAAAK